MTFALSALMLFLLSFAPIKAAAQDGADLPPGPISQTDLLQEPMPGTDVRWFIWGVPSSDVIQYEKVVLFGEAENALFFLDDINGIRTLVTYEFDRNRLWRVTFDIQKQDYPEPQKAIDDFIAFEIMLTERYGEPKSKKTIWNKDYYKNRPNQWGLAIYNGDLELGALWQDDRTDAIMTQKAENYKYKFRIVHTSREIAAEREQEKLLQTLRQDDTPAAMTPEAPALRP